jgi:multidrug resistance efflux pump
VGGLLKAVKILKPWQFGVLFVALVVAAGGAYGGYTLVNGLGQRDLGEDQQLIPVQYGNVINQIATNGALIFPVRELLTFGTQGTVAEVLVEEGDEVVVGQPLARLDAAAVTSLERSVAQARVNLSKGEDTLDKIVEAYSSLQLAQAEANVATAQLSLKKAQETLDEVKDGSAGDTALAAAHGDLFLARKEWDDKVSAARNALVIASDDYRGVFRHWLGIEMADGLESMDPNTLLDSWGVDLDALFAPSSGFQAVSDIPTTPWDEAIVEIWRNFFPGRITPTCEDGNVSLRGTCVKLEMDDAWEAYQAAQDKLDTVEIQSAKAIANAEGAVQRAEERFEPLEVAVKEKQLDVAKAKLTEAEEDLAKLLADAVDPLEVALLEAEVASAQALLETAIQRLDGATLRAPMAGSISMVNVEAGQSVNANTPSVEVVDPTVIEVDGVVDEVDVLFLREGARAEVTMDALPGQVLAGIVSSIAAAARSQQGVVSYPIRVRLQLQPGESFPEGLSATANIIIREELDVLLVPVQALYGSFEQPLVRVMLANGQIEERPVLLGNSDDFWVAVRDGLAEGDQVVMETVQAATTQFGFGGGFRQFPGGFPGGRGQRGGQ